MKYHYSIPTLVSGLVLLGSIVQAGPIQSGPIQSGPIQAGPIQSGPIQSGPKSNKVDGGESKGSTSSATLKEEFSVSIFYRGKLYRQESKYLEAVQEQRELWGVGKGKSSSAQRFEIRPGEQIERLLHPDDLKGSDLHAPKGQEIKWVFTAEELPEASAPTFEVKSYGRLPETINYESYPVTIRKASLSSTGLAFDQELEVAGIRVQPSIGEKIGMDLQYQSPPIGFSDKLSFGYGEGHELSKIRVHAKKESIPFFYPRVNIDVGVVCKFEPRSVTSKVTYEVRGKVAVKGEFYQKETESGAIVRQEVKLNKDPEPRKAFLNSEKGQAVTYRVTESMSTFYLAYQCQNPEGEVVLQRYWDEQDYPDPEIKL